MNECQVRIRPTVDALPRYTPGKSVEGGVKLSSNEMPDAPSPDVIAAMTRAFEQINRYPDLTAAPVREALAARFGVDPGRICVGTGSSALLVAALTAVCEPGSKVVYPWRSFESYPIAIPACHAEGVPVPLTVNGCHDLDSMIVAVDADTVAMILCSPNNPTGPALALADIREVAERLPQTVMLLVDEAYVDFATDTAIGTAVPLIDEFPNVLVLRTFSKAHALAGARIGYAIGHERLISAIQAVSIPFGVSSLAQAAALASLEGDAEVRSAVRYAVEQRQQMIVELRRLGYEVPDSESNFFFLPGLGADFVTACANSGLIVRAFPEGVRVTVADPESNLRFMEVAKAYKGGSVDTTSGVTGDATTN